MIFPAVRLPLDGTLCLETVRMNWEILISQEVCFVVDIISCPSVQSAGKDTAEYAPAAAFAAGLVLERYDTVYNMK